MLEVKPYSTLVEISKNLKSAAAIENLFAAEYVIINPRNRMRNYQDKYSNELRNKIFDLTRTGEMTLYALIGSCISVIIVSIGLTFPVFIWVIKDKSYVIAIFADITDEEIKAIVSSAVNFDIRTVKYKKKWILSTVGEEEKFWKLCLKGNREKNSDEKQKNKNDNKEISPGDNTNKNDKEMTYGFSKNNSTMTFLSTVLKKEEKNLLQLVKVKEIPDDKEEESEKNNKENKELSNESPSQKQDETEKQLKSPLEYSQIEEKKRKLQGKRKILSQLDIKLRNTAIIRLVLILIVFLIYGGVSLYFNYFVHDFTKSTLTQFYTLLKRSLYIPTISCMLRLALTERNKKYILKNNSIFLYTT